MDRENSRGHFCTRTYSQNERDARFEHHALQLPIEPLPLVCSHCLGKNTGPLCSFPYIKGPMVLSPKDRITVSAPNGLSLGVPTTLLAAAGGSVALSVAQLGQDSKMVQALEALDEVDSRAAENFGVSQNGTRSCKKTSHPSHRPFAIPRYDHNDLNFRSERRMEISKRDTPHNFLTVLNNFQLG